MGGLTDKQIVRCTCYTRYLVVVRLVGEKLRTHVVRRSDQGAGHVVLILENPCDAQITHFDDVGLGQEDVLRFQISVQDVFLV